MVNSKLFAGDIWLVEAGNERKRAMLGSPDEKGHPITTVFAVGDASLASADELLKDEKYSRLIINVLGNREVKEAVATTRKRGKR